MFGVETKGFICLFKHPDGETFSWETGYIIKLTLLDHESLAVSVSGTDLGHNPNWFTSTIKTKRVLEYPKVYDAAPFIHDAVLDR